MLQIIIFITHALGYLATMFAFTFKFASKYRTFFSFAITLILWDWNFSNSKETENAAEKFWIGICGSVKLQNSMKADKIIV